MISFQSRSVSNNIYDQSEKRAMYGVTGIIAVDDYSRKISAFISLSVKNAIAVYNLLMRPCLSSDSLWKQTWVDHGHEFAWSISVKQSLASLQ